jgi:hypothetical protein
MSGASEAVRSQSRAGPLGAGVDDAALRACVGALRGRRLRSALDELAQALRHHRLDLSAGGNVEPHAQRVGGVDGDDQ